MNARMPAIKRFHHLQSWVGLILLVLQGLIPATAAWGQGLWERTSLLDLRAGSVRSDLARDLSAGRYALEDGTMVDLFDWYRPRVTDLNILFLTELEPSFALIWGISTGETGQKYRIDPGLWLGVFYRAELAENQVLTFAARTLLGGAMQERPCVAFYTILDAFTQVNCRLAASTLPPQDTLQFLVNEPGSIETTFSLRYEIRF
ncbi:hypothetical protein LOKVESSMR4R_01839 [Yoonia vestfoldensis]|uniref:Uncharacterized protein n=2 Tax=Yoonia vestfoldensis TaxID=245188 RepID=A0A1Y0ECU5_9RHOB|nr:hypothetical protein LOKVESSMR4R_01839 [Yoonia vestfoldensis]